MFTICLTIFHVDHVMGVMAENRGFEPMAPGAAQIFGNAGQEYIEKFGATPTHLAKIAEKNHRHR
jgi:sterol carrier protein 2